MNKKYAIIYLSFTRLDKVKFFFKQIKKNKNFNKYQFFIYSDFGRNKKEINLVKNVRNFLEQLNLKKTLKFQKKNLGTNEIFKLSLKNTLKKNSKIVIFEEDIIPGNYTLEYFEKIFNIIDKIKDAEFITAHSLNIKKRAKSLKQLFISKRINLWGIGFNKKTFKKIVFNEKLLRKACLKNKNFLKIYKNFDDSLVYEINKFLYKSKNINMDVKFQINSLLKKMYTITPKNSLVLNYGIDGTGERAKISKNTLINDTFNYNNRVRQPNINPKSIKIDLSYEKYIKKMYSYSMMSKIVKKIKDLV